MRTIAEFRYAQGGEDIWVLGAGGSLNYLEPSFFDGRIVVSVNSAARVFGVTPSYIVLRDYNEEVPANLAAFPDIPLIVARYPYGQPLDESTLPPTAYVFEHLRKPVETFDANTDWPTDPDALVVTMSTITSAMHFAAYLGAYNIFVVAHDCGTLGSDAYVHGYEPQQPWTRDWLRKIEPQSIAVKQELIRRYGVRVYSLNPFLNFNLEGVPFVGGNHINA